jgi:Zn-dependent peptidase ImmA (M78 family)
MSKAKAQREAKRIWTEIGKPVPVPIEEIFAQYGIELQRKELEPSVSGMMVTRENSKVVVAVNKNDPANRQRFTMAHELGHYLLHRSTNPIFVDGRTFFRDEKSSSGTRIQEIEANAFAGELLMPEEAVRSRVSEKLSIMDGFELGELASNFKVSEAAMSICLSRLDLLEE